MLKLYKLRISFLRNDNFLHSCIFYALELWDNTHASFIIYISFQETVSPSWILRKQNKSLIKYLNYKILI